MITESKIDAILKKNKLAVQLSLIQNANDTIKRTFDEVAVNKQRELTALVNFFYTKQYAKGGSYCPDPNNLGKAKFVNWIDERYDTAKDDIMKFVKEYDGSKNSAEFAKKLSDIIDSDIDAKKIMRTEAEKIRTSAKMTNMRANGVKYVRYVAVMDDRVRPEHAALDGQIFPIDEAPVLGEPNCRCTYIQATEKEHEAFSEDYKEEWTAETAQKWLDTSNGKVTGFKNAINAKINVEEKRQIFTDGFSKLTPEERLNLVIETNAKYKPEWCKVSILEIIDLDVKVLKALEETQKVITESFDAPIRMPLSDSGTLLKESEWSEKSLQFLRIETDILNEGVCKDFDIKPIVRSIRSDKSFKNAGAFYSYQDRMIGVNPTSVDFWEKNVIDGKIIDSPKKEITLKNGRVVPRVTHDKMVLTHEVGHGIHNNVNEFLLAPDKNGVKLAQDDLFKAFSKRYPQYDTSNLKKFAEAYSPSEYGATKGNSGYGFELIAECFADFYDKGEKAEQISKDLVAFFKEIYNDWNLTGKTLPEIKRMKGLIEGNELFEKGVIKGLKKEVSTEELWQLKEYTKKGMSPEAIKRYNDNVKIAKETVLKDFPNIVRDYCDINVTGRRSTFAWGTGTVNFNPTDFQTILDDIKAGYKLKGSEDYQLVHHLGVELFHNAMGCNTYSNLDKFKPEVLNFWREFAMHEKSDLLDPKKVKTYKALEARMKQVYDEGKLTVVNGSTDYFAGEELIGEAVVDYYLNGANANPFSKSVMNFLKSKIR